MYLYNKAIRYIRYLKKANRAEWKTVPDTIANVEPINQSLQYSEVGEQKRLTRLVVYMSKYLRNNIINNKIKIIYQFLYSHHSPEPPKKYQTCTSSQNL